MKFRTQRMLPGATLILALGLSACLNPAATEDKAKPKDQPLGAVSALMNSNCMSIQLEGLNNCQAEKHEIYMGCMNRTWLSSDPDAANHNELYQECHRGEPGYPACPSCCDGRRYSEQISCGEFERTDRQWCWDVYQINMSNCRTRM